MYIPQETGIVWLDSAMIVLIAFVSTISIMISIFYRVAYHPLIEMRKGLKKIDQQQTAAQKILDSTSTYAQTAAQDAAAVSLDVKSGQFQQVVHILERILTEIKIISAEQDRLEKIQSSYFTDIKSQRIKRENDYRDLLDLANNMAKVEQAEKQAELRLLQLENLVKKHKKILSEEKNDCSRS